MKNCILMLKVYSLKYSTWRLYMKIILTLITLFLLSCSTDQEDISIQLLKSFENKDITVWDKYVSNDYIQHNHRFPNGKEPVIENILATKNLETRVDTLLTFSDGNYVIALNDCETLGKMTTIDIFLFNNNQIAEHWDNLETYQNEKLLEIDFSHNPNATNEEYKLYSTDYVLYGNKENLHEEFENISTGKNISLNKEYKKVEGEFSGGEYVLLVSSGYVNGKDYSFYDLLKFKENKILFHLNLAEPVPASKYWKNPNGKYFKNVNTSL